MSLTFLERIKTEIVLHKRYAQAVGRVLKYRSPVPPEELVGEFNVGIAAALHKVRPDIGDPVEYLIKNGFNRVRMAIRAEASKQIIQRCAKCGNERPFRYDKCHKCQEKNWRGFSLHSRFAPLKEDVFGNIVADGVCAKSGVDEDLALMV